MIKAELNSEFLYTVELATMDSSEVANAIIDTGCRATILTEPLVSDVLGVSEEMLSRVLENYICVPLNGIHVPSTGKTIPCVLQNVYINGELISRLWCYIACTKEKFGVIGMDFLRACNIGIVQGGAMMLHHVDENTYEANFKAPLYHAPIVELSNHKVRRKAGEIIDPT